MPQDTPEKEDLRQKMLDSINTPILKALDGEGITLSYLTKHLKKELKAKRVQVFNDKGQIIYSDPLDALEIQQRARQDAHKLRGDYPAEKHQIDGDLMVEIVNYAASKTDKDVDK